MPQSIAAARSMTPERPGPSPVPLVIGPTEDYSARLTLPEVIALVRRHLLLIIAITAAVLAMTAYAVRRHVPEFTATSTIRVANERQALTSSIGDASPEQMMTGSGADPILSHVEVITSRVVVERVVAREHLQLVPLDPALTVTQFSSVTFRDAGVPDTIHFTFGSKDYTATEGVRVQRLQYNVPAQFRSVSFAVVGQPGVKRADLEVDPVDVAVEKTRKQLRVTRRPNTNVIDIEFTSSNANLAHRVANAVAETYEEFDASAAQRESKRRYVFIEEQLKLTEEVLNQALAALASFRSSKQVYGSRERILAEQTGMLDLQVRRAELGAEKRMYEGLTAQSDPRTLDNRRIQTLLSSPSLAANPVIQQMATQLALYQVQRDSLASTGSARSNPDVLRMDALIRDLQARIIDAVRSHVAALGARLAALDELQARTSAQMSGLPNQESAEARYAQQVDAATKIADQLREEYQKARISEAVEAGQIQILDAAAVPRLPLPNHGGLKLLFGLMIGIMMGGGVAYIREHVDTALRERGDLERVLGVPNLAIVPQFADKASGQKLDTMARELITLTDPRSPSSEAFRGLRTNILFSQAVRKLRTIAITSSSPGEGKTTTAANLGAAFALQDLSVLVIDCDLRRAQMHRTFSLPNTVGLTTYLMGAADAGAIVQSTQTPKLSVITSGPLPPNPAELLGSGRLRSLLGVLQESFDLIILDAPPVLVATDASIIAGVVDGLVMVVRAGMTPRGAAEQSMQQLRSVGATVIGSVLNDADAEVQRYGTDYYAYEYYGMEK